MSYFGAPPAILTGRDLIRARMLGGLPSATADERGDEFLGVEPLELDTTPDPEAQAHPGYLERLGVALAENPIQGGGALGSFVSGFAGSLGAAGTRAAARRAKLEASAETQRKTRDAANLQATRDYRTRRAASIRDKDKAKETERVKTAEFDRDNPVVDEDLIAAYPGLSTLPRMKGKRISRELLKRESFLEPSRQRAGASATRAQEAADRANRLAESQLVNTVGDDYTKHPDVATYRGAIQNYQTMESAAKQKSGPGDLALIVSYVRATEPGLLSVVRQEELNNVQGAVGEFERVKAIPAGLLRGDRLTPEARSRILSTAREIVLSRRPAYEAVTEQFQRRSAALDVDPTLFIQNYPAPVEPPKFSTVDRDYVKSLGLK